MHLILLSYLTQPDPFFLNHKLTNCVIWWINCAFWETGQTHDAGLGGLKRNLILVCGIHNSASHRSPLVKHTDTVTAQGPRLIQHNQEKWLWEAKPYAESVILSLSVRALRLPFQNKSHVSGRGTCSEWEWSAPTPVFTPLKGCFKLSIGPRKVAGFLFYLIVSGRESVTNWPEANTKHILKWSHLIKTSENSQ